MNGAKGREPIAESTLVEEEAGRNAGAIRNPFDDPALAAGYEAWYETEGKAADRLERGLLGWLLAGFPQARSALEIGAGTGHFARWMGTLGWRVVALDRSAPMLAEAARRGGLALVRGDAAALPFASRSFDVTLLITTLEFLSATGRGLREAARVGRQGLVLGVLNRWHPLAWKRRRSRQPPWDTAHFYSPPELGGAVQAALGPQAAAVDWFTTLVPCPWRWSRSRLPIGAFIGMRVHLAQPEGR
ncbi:MAG: class I SAM-dependent methyltransferase [Chloroflexota bacterium]